MYEQRLDWFCHEVGVDYFHLRSHRRDAQTVGIRRIAACFFREFGLSYLKIGEVLNREHTSIMHLCRTASEEERGKAQLLARRWGDAD